VGRAGAGTVRYGGDTSSVEVEDGTGTRLLLDAGSGIVHADTTGEPGPLHVLLTHLHMDHIQGLGFLRPLFDPEIEVHIWGPVAPGGALTDRLARYLSPPLFPVHLRDLPSLTLHELGPTSFQIESLQLTVDYVIHPGPTLGFRVESNGKSLAYLPDHEPALGNGRIVRDPAWTSGYELATGVDLLIHDTQYTDDEYAARVGWGHSTLTHAVDFGELAGVGRLVTFHHEPDHSDELIDRLHGEVTSQRRLSLELEPGLAGAMFEV
jgi:phosphoribosyl 1,2-cyclic phosphodiesterase